MSDSSIFNKGDEVSRRQFMIGAARNCLGVSVLPMLGSTIATNDTMAPHAITECSDTGPNILPNYQTKIKAWPKNKSTPKKIKAEVCTVRPWTPKDGRCPRERAQ